MIKKAGYSSPGSTFAAMHTMKQNTFAAMHTMMHTTALETFQAGKIPHPICAGAFRPGVNETC